MRYIGITEPGISRLEKLRCVMVKSATMTTSWPRAQEIMGNRAIGIDMANKLGLKVSEAEANKYATVPFSEVELEAARDSWMYLVAMPEVTFLELREVALDSFRYMNWFDGEKFTEEKSRSGYHLLGELSSSTSRNWNEQQAMIPDSFEIPKTVEMTYLAVAVLPQEAFPDWVRTVDVVSGGGHVYVGVWVRDCEVDVSYWDSIRVYVIGLACGQFRPLIP